MLHTRRRALRVAAVAAVATAGLVMTAASGAAAGSHHAASAAPKKEKEWTQTGIGSVITQSDGSMLSVASVQNSLDKDGAVVAKITLNGNAGTNTATRYDANGIGKFKEEFTLGATDASGMIPYTGSGKCVQGGTGVHKGEKCKYTYTGTLNPNTNVVNFNITGTTTR
jgi:antitoxin component YwqK of YwqJK toxin-antitoxin module